jgi:UMF1 family MFS transporter
MYDWANSAYNLVITSTIFPAYYVGITTSKIAGQPSYVNFFGHRFINTALQNYALGMVFLLVAFSSPILSSIADYRRNKKLWLRWFSYLGAFSCIALFFYLPNGSVETGVARTEYGIIAFSIAALGYWGSLVFYNSYLPDIAAPEDRDRVSAKGFSMGYIGSVLLQIICFVIIVMPEKFGMDANTTLPIRLSFLLTGLWWFGFSQITLRAMPMGSREERKSKKHVLINGFHELKLVWHQLKQMPATKRFLFAYFLYSMGVQTVMLVAAGFAKKEIFTDPKDEPKLLTTIILIQLVAILGAWGMSRLSSIIGNWWVLFTAVLIWIGVCIAAYSVYAQTTFYMVAAVVGLVMGGIQSMSRSTYSKLLPVTQDTTSFFSFYDVTEKIALVIGLFLFAYVEENTTSMRNSIIPLGIFFCMGLLALLYARPAFKQFFAAEKAANR